MFILFSSSGDIQNEINTREATTATKRKKMSCVVCENTGVCENRSYALFLAHLAVSISDLL
jgi:hypothetical protein